MGKDSTNIHFKKLKAEKAISVEHKGSYSKLGEAYAFALNWVKEKGYQINGSIRERYIHGCWDTKEENNYLTEIQIPIK
jgi:effector-binding domain-containing protein